MTLANPPYPERNRRQSDQKTRPKLADLYKDIDKKIDEGNPPTAPAPTLPTLTLKKPPAG